MSKKNRTGAHGGIHHLHLPHGTSERDKVGVAIRSGKFVVAWVTREGALIYDPTRPKIQVCPNIDAEGVASIVAAESPIANLLIAPSVTGLSWLRAGMSDQDACAMIWEQAQAKAPLAAVPPGPGIADPDAWRQKVISAIKSGRMVAWKTEPGAIIFEKGGLSMRWGASREQVEALATGQDAVLINGVTGLASAVYELSRREQGWKEYFRCDTPGCLSPGPACEDANCHDKLWTAADRLANGEKASFGPGGNTAVSGQLTPEAVDHQRPRL